MKSILRLLHDQVIGMLATGKQWRTATSAVDRGASKLFSAVLYVLGIALVVAPLFLDFIPPRVALRAIVVSVLVFGAASSFRRGNSVFAMARDVVRNWIPFGLLLYAYIWAGKQAISIFKDHGSSDFAFGGGILIMAMTFLGCLTSWIHATVLTERSAEDGESRRALILALRAYAMILVAFFLGGAFMLAWATGLVDWFFVGVLGL